MSYFVVILAILSTLGCNEGPSKKPSPAPVANPVAPAEVVQPPENRDTANTACKQVDASQFLEKAHGYWQRFAPGMHSPNCMLDPSSSQFSRSFISFDMHAGTFETVVSRYGGFPNGVTLCKQGGAGSGSVIKLGAVKPVRLCQTTQLLETLGANFYYLQTDGAYQIISTTSDTTGRTVVLIGFIKSSHPNITADDFSTWADHNDYRSIRIEK